MAPTASPFSTVSALVCESMHPLHEICRRAPRQPACACLGGCGVEGTLTTSAGVDLRSLNRRVTCPCLTRPFEWYCARGESAMLRPERGEGRRYQVREICARTSVRPERDTRRERRRGKRKRGRTEHGARVAGLEQRRWRWRGRVRWRACGFSTSIRTSNMAYTGTRAERRRVSSRMRRGVKRGRAGQDAP